MQLRRETLGSQIYDLLRDRILCGQLPGGARILQSALSEEMGISRIPIRDALQRLESDRSTPETAVQKGRRNPAANDIASKPLAAE